MPELVRRIGLALAPPGFTFQTAVAASLRCEIAMAFPAPVWEHGGGHHHDDQPSSHSPAPMHSSGAIGRHQTTVPSAQNVTLPFEARQSDRVGLRFEDSVHSAGGTRACLPPAIVPPSLG